VSTRPDNRVAVAAPIRRRLEENLLKGSPKITASRAALAGRSLRSARPARKPALWPSGARGNGAAPTLEGAWKPFTDAGLLPTRPGLFLIARAITPARPRPAF